MGPRPRSSSGKNRTGTRRRPFVLAALVVGLVLASPGSAPALSDFTWTGASTSSNWSDPTNWGGASPSGSVGTLSFPALTGCNTGTDACYTSHNDLTGVSAIGLSIDDGVGYSLTGNAITLGAGGLSASTGASPPGSPALVSLPVALSAAQTWSLNGASGNANGVGQLQLYGNVTGTGDTLAIDTSNGGKLHLGGDTEVGPVTITGANSSLSGGFAGQNGSVSLAGKLDASNGQAVSVSHGELNDVGPASSGPLTITAGAVELGNAGAPAPSGMLTVEGAATLDSASLALFSIQQAGTTPGTDYGQLSATGNVNLGGASLSVFIGSTCPTLNSADVYTLVTTTGGTLSGTFSNAPNNGTISTQGSCPSQTLQISYSSTAVTATVVSNITTGAPVNQTRPTITGTDQQDQTLTEHNGTWSNSPTRYGYQWEDCDAQGNNCAAITGATNQTYTLARADDCHTIRVEETATNNSGTGGPATSDPTGLVNPGPTADFTWTGGAAPDPFWSTAANWSRPVAPCLTVGALTFPAAACTSNGCGSLDDISGLTASSLNIVSPNGLVGAWHTQGSDPLTLTSGLSSTAVNTGSGSAAPDVVLDMPIDLAGSNTWTIGNTATLLNGALSGPGQSLSVAMSGAADLDLRGTTNEVGPVTINGSGFCCQQVHLGTQSAAGDLNGTNGNPVTLGSDVSLFGPATVGPLTANAGSQLVTAYAPTQPGDLSVHGAATLAAGSTVVYLLSSQATGGGSPHLTATGTLSLGGASILPELDCDPPIGTRFTLVEGAGGVSGTFAGAPDGGVVQTVPVFQCATRSYLRLNYTATTVVATVVAPPTVQTGTASNVTASTATLGGSVNPNDATVTDCHFEYGQTTAYGSSVPCAETVSGGTTAVGVSAQISNLLFGTTYHFRLVATNAAGTTNGADATFGTTGAPPPTAPSPPSLVAIVIGGVRSQTPDDSYKPLDLKYDYSNSTSWTPSVHAVLDEWNPPWLHDHGYFVPAPREGEESLTDRLAAMGAVILPYSYHGAYFTDPADTPDPTFHVSPADASVPGNTSPVTQAVLLDDEVANVHGMWPKAQIVIIADSGGGVVAMEYWDRYWSFDHRGVTRIYTFDSPINGVQFATPCTYLGSQCPFGPVAADFYAELWRNLESRDPRLTGSDVNGVFNPIGTPGDLVYLLGDVYVSGGSQFETGGLLSQLFYNCQGFAVETCNIYQPPDLVDPCAASQYYGGLTSVSDLTGSSTKIRDDTHVLATICPAVVDYVAGDINSGLAVPAQQGGPHIRSGRIRSRSPSTRSRAATASLTSAPAYGPTATLSPPALSSGETATIKGVNLGTGPGQILLIGRRATLHPTISSWSDSRITFTAPPGLDTGPVIVIRSDGAPTLAGLVTALRGSSRARHVAVRPGPAVPDGEARKVTLRALNRHHRGIPGVRLSLSSGLTQVSCRSGARGSCTVSVVGYNHWRFVAYSGRAFCTVTLKWQRPPRLIVTSTRRIRHGRVTVRFRIRDARGRVVPHLRARFSVIGPGRLVVRRGALTTARGTATVTVTGWNRRAPLHVTILLYGGATAKDVAIARSG